MPSAPCGSPIDQRTRQEDEDDALESSRFDALIANSQGIFGVSAERTVQEFVKYYAYGGGASYAMGAMYAGYDRPELDAQGIARLAIEAAAEFDDGTALPATCVCIPAAAEQDGG